MMARYRIELTGDELELLNDMLKYINATAGGLPDKEASILRVLRHKCRTATEETSSETLRRLMAGLPEGDDVDTSLDPEVEAELLRNE